MKYSNMLSNRLERFKIKSNMPYKANFRCPLCGDSEKSKIKCRAWIEDRGDNQLRFKCYNCGVGHLFYTFLEKFEPSVFQDYLMDRAMEKNGLTNTKPDQNLEQFRQKESPVFKATKAGSPLLRIKKISALKHDHPAKLYVESRLIPPETHFRLYYAPKFKKWVNSIIPGKMEDEEVDEPRLILPFIDENGDLFGFQGRSFAPNAFLRYISIMFDGSYSKIFGMDQCDVSKGYYIFEGPLDSLFIGNSIAMAGSTVNYSALQNTENAVFVFDNEPRKKETVDKMENALKAGFKVCVWSPKIGQKDVNDMILKGGYSIDRIKWEIDRRTFSGLEGLLELKEWKKVN
jgi:transcription elongation factor Elf1